MGLRGRARCDNLPQGLWPAAGYSSWCMQRRNRAGLALAAALAGLAARSRAETPPEVVEAPEFRVRATAVGPAAPGLAGRLQVLVEALGGRHLNAKYPIHLWLESGTGLVFEQARVGRAEEVAFSPCEDDAAHPCAAVVSARFSVFDREASTPRAGGSVSFGLCEARRCLVRRVAVSAPLQPPSPEGGAELTPRP